MYIDRTNKQRYLFDQIYIILPTSILILFMFYIYLFQFYQVDGLHLWFHFGRNLANIILNLFVYTTFVLCLFMLLLISHFGLISIGNSGLGIDEVDLSVHLSVCQHFYLCRNIQKTVDGHNFKTHTHVHVNKTFQMSLCLVTLKIDFCRQTI